MKFASTLIGLSALAASSNAAPLAADTTDVNIVKGLVGFNGTSESQHNRDTATAAPLLDDRTIVLTPTQLST